MRTLLKKIEAALAAAAFAEEGDFETARRLAAEGGADHADRRRRSGGARGRDLAAPHPFLRHGKAARMP